MDLFIFFDAIAWKCSHSDLVNIPEDQQTTTLGEDLIGGFKKGFAGEKTTGYGILAGAQGLILGTKLLNIGSVKSSIASTFPFTSTRPIAKSKRGRTSSSTNSAGFSKFKTSISTRRHIWFNWTLTAKFWCIFSVDG